MRLYLFGFLQLKAKMREKPVNNIQVTCTVDPAYNNIACNDIPHIMIQLWESLSHIIYSVIVYSDIQM